MAQKDGDTPTVKLRVTEALTKDVGRAFARMGPEDLERLQTAVGDTVEVEGKRKAVCKVMPAYQDLRGQSRVQLDGSTRENAGVALDEQVRIRRVHCRPAERVVLAPTNVVPAERDLAYIGSLLDGLPVLELAALYQALWSKGPPEREVVLEVLREGARQTLKVYSVDRMKTFRRAQGV